MIQYLYIRCFGGSTRSKETATTVAPCPHFYSIPFTVILRKSRMKRPRRPIRVTTPLATKRGSDAEASESDAETRPKKAQPKKGTRIRARHTGKLRQMLDMPLEVILEVMCTTTPMSHHHHADNVTMTQICAHLHPKDILNLSRASKDLRTFFLSRNSMSIWKVALANLPDLPPCPDDLSEPAYVNLMFSLQCHVCRLLPHVH